MSSYSFESFAELSDIDFSESIIWVLYADKIPPHIGFSTKQTFFSLKVSGKDENLKTESVLELINRKKIPSLLIQISTKTSVESMQKVYSLYQNADSNTTCLHPIKDLVEQEARQLSDLLEKITPEIKTVAGCYLPVGYSALPSYSFQDIQSYIQDLSNDF